MRSRRWVFCTVAVAVGVSWLVHSPASVRADEPRPSAKQADQIKALAETINRLIEEKWAESDVTPSAPADDAEFLRRVSLDLSGKIPTVAEVREFLDDSALDKRPRAVDRLLAGPAYVAHFTRFWRALLLPENEGDVQIQFLAPDFEAWLRQKVADNVGFDVIARELISLPMEGSGSTHQISPRLCKRAPA